MRAARVSSAAAVDPLPFTRGVLKSDTDVLGPAASARCRQPGLLMLYRRIPRAAASRPAAWVWRPDCCETTQRIAPLRKAGQRRARHNI